ncbi:GH3 auxin-responsive promoter family protein [Ochrovirga pacifica]|uniref:GH3 auxin-responsive promoter family protein n=1 Tax=Ochrovirga pacifica TaxID=1042376 RepID=UPI0002559FED|nr:GH3 auxin-responsive promoter family protein [Ochrovirga pacifica]
MTLPLINSILSWLLKKRKHQIELFLKYPVEVQNEQLLKLLKTANKTSYGKQYQFKKIKNYQEFVEKVPLVNYEQLSPYIEEQRTTGQAILWSNKIKWYAKSSGTTNAKSKFIPVSEDAIKLCHFKGGKDMLTLFFNNNQEANLFSGKNLRLGGSSAVYEDNDAYFGDLSAIIIENMPLWADFSSAPKQETALMSEWESKMDAIIKETVNENITSLAGVPSWMLVLLERVLLHTGKQNILEVWPNLEVYFHGGVNFSPYKEQYKKLIPSDKFKYYETYNASEGFFAIQDQNHSDELLLMLDYGIFYEFIPMDAYRSINSTTVSLADVELGKNYAMVITTNAGLWRYIIGDTIKFTSLSPHRIKITGRTKHFINAFGEELIMENASHALKVACQATQALIKEYTAAPIFMDHQQKGGHEWLIEFEQMPNDLQTFVHSLDHALKAINSDYEAKRYNNMTLSMPTLTLAEKNQFHHWLKSKNKLGGQHKVPRLFNDRTFIDEIKACKPI